MGAIFAAAHAALAAHQPLPPHLDDLIEQERAMHYQALAAQAAGKKRCEFRSHWLEGRVVCEYEVEEEARYQFGTLPAEASLQEIYVGGIPMLQFLSDATVLRIGDEMRAHLAKRAEDAQL